MDAGHKDAGVLLYAHVNFGPGHAPVSMQEKCDLLVAVFHYIHFCFHPTVNIYRNPWLRGLVLCVASGLIPRYIKSGGECERVLSATLFNSN